MANGYNYVPPYVSPEETFAKRLSNLGKQVQSAAMQQGAQRAEAIRALRAEQKTRFAQIAQIGKNTNDFSRADQEELNSLKQQSLDILAENPELLPALQIELGNYYSMGKQNTEAIRGAGDTSETYQQYLNGTKKFAGETGVMADVSSSDFEMKLKSYDELGQPTGETWTSPSTGLEHTIMNYYEPGTMIPMEAIFYGTYPQEGGFIVDKVQDPNNSTTMLVARNQDGVEVDRRVVAGPLMFYSRRGTGSFFAPRTVNIARQTPADYLNEISLGLLTRVQQGINNGKYTVEEGEAIILNDLRTRYNNEALGEGMRSASIDLWNTMNPTYEGGWTDDLFERSGEGAETESQRQGLKTPLETYEEQVLGLAALEKKVEKPTQTKPTSAQTSWDGDRDGFRQQLGLPQQFQDDLQGSESEVYTNEEWGLESELKAMGVSSAQLAAEKRAQLPISGGIKPTFGNTTYSSIEAFPNVGDGVLFLTKRDEKDWEGKLSFYGQRAGGRSKSLESDRIHNPTYWDKFPSSQYDVIQIYKDPSAFDPKDRYTDKFLALAQDFANKYKNAEGVDIETLEKQIIKLAQ